MRVYLMRFGLVLSTLILAQGTTQAEWVALDPHDQSHPLQTAYIDPSASHREGDVVTIAALIDWKEMQGGRTPTRFYSTKITKQFHCGKKQVRTLASTDFYGHMGTGEIIGGGPYAGVDHWVNIEAETINHGLWEAACGKR